MDELEEIQYLLERMMDLAACSANDACDDTRRANLQKGLVLLRGLLDEAAERYEKSRGTME